MMSGQPEHATTVYRRCLIAYFAARNEFETAARQYERALKSGLDTAAVRQAVSRFPGLGDYLSLP